MVTIIAGLSILILMLIGYKLYNKQHRSIESEIFIPISASQLFDDYENDEENSDKKYLNKVLEVNGVVSDVLTNQHDEPVIFLKTNSPLYGVSCTMIKFIDSEIQPSMNVTIKGVCKGYLSDVIITKGVQIIKSN